MIDKIIGPVILGLVIAGGVLAGLWVDGRLGYITERDSKYRGNGIYEYELILTYKGTKYWTSNFARMNSIECDECHKDSAYKILDNLADSFITDLRNHKCK